MKQGHIFFLALCLTTTAAAGAAAQPLPKPALQLTALELYSASGKSFVRYSYDVTNKAAFPAEMFAPAPDLPPCGLNANSSRSWVDVYDASGKRLYGFCALGAPSELGKLWFSLPEGTAPPARVYIESTDRKSNTKYKSNLAKTSFNPCPPPARTKR
jgi:hypothetical protein